jgi:hypothetical protein
MAADEANLLARTEPDDDPAFEAVAQNFLRNRRLIREIRERDERKKNGELPLIGQPWPPLESPPTPDGEKRVDELDALVVRSPTGRPVT